ncbi:MAG: M1 family metallopeptidase [Candidatus Marinimicrobia bacterium]|nr:M1 family metallopeptidase [Candidatus Neomarinimicrobiota bacterium]
MIRRCLQLFLLSTVVLGLKTSSGGPLTKNQAAMDVHHYELRIALDPEKKTIGGTVTIGFNLKRKPHRLVLDLLSSYSVSNAWVNEKSMVFFQRGDKLFIENPGLDLNSNHHLKISYKGKPPEAANPPWDGGVTWTASEDGYPWIAVSCQQNGAHIWYPCKEHPSDKPDSVDIYVTVPEPLKVASNGLLQGIVNEGNRRETWHWKTQYPISTYNVNITIGNFETVSRRGLIQGQPLYMEFYVLPESRDGAEELLEKAEKYLNFYAEQFGPYPWQDEKFGLVETPYWGMEHQTIIAYGNKYKNTKLGYDFLLFHEMGHEWWGNYLSVSDWADFWIHEGFVTYAEALYVEKEFGLGAYHAFMRDRCGKNISNEHPIVPERPATTEATRGNDVYYKGAYVLHMLRYLVGDLVLKSTLKEFIKIPKRRPNNQTSTREFAELLEENSGMALEWFFDQYLFKKDYPTLNMKTKIYHNGEKQFIELWWSETGFILPVEVRYQGKFSLETITINVSEKPTGVSIPATSTLDLDPLNWLLFTLKQH